MYVKLSASLRDQFVNRGSSALQVSIVRQVVPSGLRAVVDIPQARTAQVPGEYAETAMVLPHVSWAATLDGTETGEWWLLVFERSPGPADVPCVPCTGRALLVKSQEEGVCALAELFEALVDGSDPTLVALGGSFGGEIRFLRSGVTHP